MSCIVYACTVAHSKWKTILEPRQSRALCAIGAQPSSGWAVHDAAAAAAAAVRDNLMPNVHASATGEVGPTHTAPCTQHV